MDHHLIAAQAAAADTPATGAALHTLSKLKGRLAALEQAIASQDEVLELRTSLEVDQLWADLLFARNRRVGRAA